MADLLGWTTLHHACATGEPDDLSNCNVSALDGCTPLMVAVGRGDLALVERLLAAGADPRAATDDSFTPVYRAACEGDAPLVEALLRAGAQVETRCAKRFLIRRLEARVRSTGGSQGFLAELYGVDPTYPDVFAVRSIPRIPADMPAALRALVTEDGSRLLLEDAVFERHRSAGKKLGTAFVSLAGPQLYTERAARLLRGETLSDADRADLSRLAAERGDLAVAEFLLRPEHRADQKPALLAAARDGQLEVLQAILKLTAPTREALTTACWRDRVEAVKALLAAGADPNRKDGQRQLPLLVAAAHGPRCLAPLLKAGARLEARGSSGETALMLAADRYEPQGLDTLLKAGADPRAVDKKGRNALHYALDFGRPANVPRLLAAGTPVNLVDSEGKTPLHLAILSFQVKVDVLKLLLDAGADLETAEPTPLATAIEAYREDKARLLLERGARIPDAGTEARLRACGWLGGS